MNEQLPQPALVLVVGNKADDLGTVAGHGNVAACKVARDAPQEYLRWWRLCRTRHVRERRMPHARDLLQFGWRKRHDARSRQSTCSALPHVPVVADGHSRSAHSAARRAWMRVVSNSGTAVSSCPTSSVISVHPRMMASAPSSTSLAMTL